MTGTDTANNDDVLCILYDDKIALCQGEEKNKPDEKKCRKGGSNDLQPSICLF